MNNPAKPDRVEEQSCDNHGTTLHVDDQCVLCAEDNEELDESMEMAYHIEKAKRGDKSSRRKVLAWATPQDEDSH